MRDPVLYSRTATIRFLWNPPRTDAGQNQRMPFYTDSSGLQGLRTAEVELGIALALLLLDVMPKGHDGREVERIREEFLVLRFRGWVSV